MPPSNSNSAELQTAVVTGASSGIGRAIAIRLARRGYRTILIARRADRLQALADEISNEAPAIILPLDISHRDAVRETIPSYVENYRPISVLVNCAGVGQYRAFLEQGEDDFLQLMQVNCFAAADLIRAILPQMLERRSGHIINIASISAKMGPWGHSAYSASKSAMVTLTQSLAAEYAPHGVRFSVVYPGVVKTEFFHRPDYAVLLDRILQHAIEPDRVAAVVERLLDRPRLEVCVPWYYRFLDGIRVLSAEFAHRIVARASRPKLKE